MHSSKMSQNTLESWDLLKHIAEKRELSKSYKVDDGEKLFYETIFLPTTTILQCDKI